MASRLDTDLRNTGCAALASAFDNGGTLKLYTGSQPASANDAASGTLLCTITLPDDPFGAPSGGIASKQGTWSGTGAANGTAGWGRLTSADGTQRMDGEVGSEFTLDSSSVSVGSPVTCTACTVTVNSGE